MSADYWNSTQRRFWLFTKEQLAGLRQRRQDEERSLVQMYPLPEQRHLNLFFFQQLNRLGKRMQVRQQALATAQVYLKRFYTKVELRRTNPYLVMATALYLACKTEECPQHIRQVVQEAKALWPDTHCLEIARLGECEFYMISELSSQLIVHAPYRTLHNLQTELALAPDEFAQAWAIVNDSYMTDIPLLYPPYVVAVMALLWVIVLQPTASSVAGAASSSSLSGAGGAQTPTTASPTAGASLVSSGSVGSMGSMGSLGPLSSLGSLGSLGSMSSATTATTTTTSSMSLPPPLLLPLSTLASLGGGSNADTPGGGSGGGTPGMGGMVGTPTTMAALSSLAAGGSAASLAQAQAQQGRSGGGSGTSNTEDGNGGSGNSQDSSRNNMMQGLIKWLADSGIDIEAASDCTQEMVSFYVSVEDYNEKQTREQIHRFIKARGLDR